MAKKPGRMAKKGKKTVDRTNAELADQELEVLRTTTFDFEALRPQVTGQATYDSLIAAVRESTARNEDIAQLKTRLGKLGHEGIAFAKKLVELTA